MTMIIGLFTMQGLWPIIQTYKFHSIVVAYYININDITVMYCINPQNTHFCQMVPFSPYPVCTCTRPVCGQAMFPDNPLTCNSH